MKTKRSLLIVGIVMGALFTLAPFFGVIGTVLGMVRTFSRLSEAGIVDPRGLSDSIQATLFSTATGLVLFPLGIVILTLSLVFFFRPRAASPPPLPPPPRLEG